MIRGFKGFDKDLKCRGFAYEIGKEYTTDTANVCESGFHFCENPLDVFSYYAPATSRFAIVDGSGKTDKHDQDSKVACTHLRIEAEISLEGYIKESTSFLFQLIAKAKKASTGNSAHCASTGYSAHCASTGDSAHCASTGDYAHCASTGNSAHCASTGNYAHCASTGDYAHCASTGNSAHCASTGYSAHCASTGNSAHCASTGNSAHCASTGYSAHCASTGYSAHCASTGDYAHCAVSGKHSIAAAIGIVSKAKGKKTCWLVLAEWKQDKDGKWVIKSVKSAPVDGKKIKEDVFYTLKNGKFVEVKE